MNRSISMTGRLLSVFALALGALMAAGSAKAQIAPDAARAMLTKVDPAVVSVKITAQMSYAMEGRQGEKEEQEQETTGIVVAPSGRAAGCVAARDPTAAFQTLMSAMGDADGGKFNMQTDITDLKLHFSDGREVPGEIAIRDKDLDLAFIKPKTPLTAPAAAVDFSAAAEAKVLDPVLLVFRLGKSANWTIMGRLEGINGILAKPRTMFLLNSYTGNTMGDSEAGALALGVDGKVLGMCVMRTVAGTGKASGDMYQVVMPAKDVLSVAKQAPQ